MNARIVATVMPGRASGMAIQRNACQIVAPSTNAASSSSFARPSKKPVIIHTTSGTVMTRWVIINGDQRANQAKPLEQQENWTMWDSPGGTLAIRIRTAALVAFALAMPYPAGTPGSSASPVAPNDTMTGLMV